MTDVSVTAALQQTVSHRIGLLTVYSRGLGVPFLIAVVGAGYLAPFLARFRRLLTAALTAALVASGCEPQGASTPSVTRQAAQGRTRHPTSESAAGVLLPPWELSDLSGRLQPVYLRSANVTVINFWATWCVPCLREIPELVALNDSWHARGIRLVGVAIASGSAADVQAFATAHGMGYPLLTANEDPARRYFRRFNLMLALPVTLVVDHAGIIRRRLIGPQTRDAFEAAVREAS